MDIVEREGKYKIVGLIDTEKEIGTKFNCGGGGPAHFATAGFKNIENLKKAFNYSVEKIKNKINEL